MSGGHFNYAQFGINDIIEGIEEAIKINKRCDEQGYCPNFSEDTILKFKEGLDFLKVAKIYANRIDLLISDDDSEGTFHEELKLDFDKIVKPKKSA